MQTLSTVAAAAPSGWLYGVGSVLIGGAVVPFLLSVLPDAVALFVQRGRRRLLVGVVAATIAALAVLRGTLSLAMRTNSGYLVEWPAFVELLFGVGMVVALWHGLPRVMRAVLRRRHEDRERREGDTSAEVEPADRAPMPVPAVDLQPLPA